MNLLKPFARFLAGAGGRARIISINFHEPWWNILWQQWHLWVIVAVGQSLLYMLMTLLPLFLGWVIEKGRVDYAIYLTIGCLGMYVLEYAVKTVNQVFQLQTIYSTHYSAYRYLLEVDPLFHTRRSSGTILAKIDRASRAYEDWLDSITHDGLLEMVVKVFTVVGSMLYTDRTLGFITLLTLVLLAGSSTSLFLTIIPRYTKKWIEADDKFKSISLESLSQIGLIRACFASEESQQRLFYGATQSLTAESVLWNRYLTMRSFFKMAYSCGVLVVVIYLMRLMHQGSISPLTATALLLTYMRGTDEIVKLDKPLRYFVQSYVTINDFFVYMCQFGVQTFPALETGYVAVAEKAPEQLSVVARGLHFDYQTEARIFEEHSLELVVPTTQKNKLYGIIGPSGSGKTTLLSILGGQLKPREGTVLINGIDIYRVGDLTRRSLLALQAQTAASLRGTLRSNLIFGIPQGTHFYRDEQLIDILRRVGLWQLFVAKDGLDTFVGESGFTLSGGQRQRLNFAGLYLRAQYFKPSVILIDEPTSSLDEISEQAITELIRELSTNALTLVIAHRIKTLSSAAGLLDISMLPERKDMTFLPMQELLRCSPYYQKLLHGDVEIGD